MPAMPPPFQPDAVRKLLQGLGLLRKSGKPTVTLRQAIEKNWLELWYQPKVELANKRLVGRRGADPRRAIRSSACCRPARSCPARAMPTC